MKKIMGKAHISTSKHFVGSTILQPNRDNNKEQLVLGL